MIADTATNFCLLGSQGSNVFPLPFGCMEVGSDTIRRAHAVHPIVDLPVEYALISRAPETTIFPLLAQLRIGVIAYGVLSRGLLSRSAPAVAGDFRAHLPRFTGESLDRNRLWMETPAGLAVEHRTRYSEQQMGILDSER